MIYSDKHPDFVIEELPEGYMIRLINFITGQPKENFGIYNRWWMAERKAREYQRWADAESL
jgi:hypothetical protein